MFNAATRLVLVIIFAAVSAFSAFAADGRFVFRYKAGTGEPGVETPAGEEYDITARFLGIAGHPFDSIVPVKPGTFVSSWNVKEGFIPSGLEFDDETGRISGTPDEVTSRRMLSVMGYGASGTEASYASVQIDIVEPRSAATEQEFYARTGAPFHHVIAKSSELPVHEWLPVLPLPEWAATLNGALTGTPPKPGVWAVALSGVDFDGKEIAFTHGSIVVEDGPAVAFIADRTNHRSQGFNVRGHVERAIGDIRWELEGDGLPSDLQFDFKDGRISGVIRAYDTGGVWRLKATDVDGTSGYSNEFELRTLPADISIASVSDLYMTVNRKAYVQFEADEVVGERTWSLEEGALPPGVNLAPANGRLTGTPTEAGEWQGTVVKVEGADGISETSNPFTIHVRGDRLTAQASQVHVRVGDAYSTEQAVASGGTGPYSFELAEGETVPEGALFDSSTATFSGTMQNPGNQSVSVVPLDSTGRRGEPFTVGITGYSQPFVSMPKDAYERVRLSELDPVIQPEALPYSVMPGASWSLSPAQLPVGLSFSSRTGVISGTPLELGAFGPYAVSVIDGGGAAATTGDFTLEIADLPDMSLSVRDREIERAIGQETRIANASHTVGRPVYSLDAGSAPLPEGLWMDEDGILRGRTLDVGDFEGVVVKAVDTEGREAVSAPFAIRLVMPDPIKVHPVNFTWTEDIAFTTPEPEISRAAGTYTFAALSPLPDWLSFDPATGTLSGSGAEPGTYGPYAIELTDEMERKATANVTVTLLPAMVISVSPGIEGKRLQALQPVKPTVSNAVGTKTLALAGALPSGLSFDSSSGNLSGTPTEEGVWNVVFSATDVTGQTASAAATVSVGPREPLAIAYSIPRLSVGHVTGLPRLPLQPTNAAGTVEYSIAGDLPPGITFDESSGAFGGIPEEPGKWSGIVVSGTDSEGVSASSPAITIGVAPGGEIAVPETVVRKVRIDRPFSTAAVAVSNAVQPLRFDTSSGGALSDPDGLELDGNTGSLSGTATSTGFRSFGLRVTDDLDRLKAFTLRLQVVGDLQATFADVVAKQYETVSVLPSVINDAGRLAYSLSGALPDGFSFDNTTGRVHGTSSEVGDYGPFMLTVADGFDSISIPFAIRIDERDPVTVEQASLSLNRYAPVPADAAPVVKNAVGSVTFTLTGPDLPGGLHFDAASGRIVGTPGVQGEFGPYELEVRDDHDSASTAFSISVGPRLPLEAWFPSAENDALANYAYALTPSIRNAVGEVEWSLQAGMLPPGLSFDEELGQIVGTPTETGSWAGIVIRARDSASGVDDTQQIAITVKADGLPIVLVPADMQTKVGYDFVTETPEISNAIGDYVLMSPQATALGLGFDPLTGVMWGAFDSHGTRIVDLEVTDMTNRVTSEPQVIVVSPNLRLTMQTNVFSMVNRPMSAVKPVTDYAFGPVTYELKGGLPEGLSFDEATGTISGTPTEQTRIEGLVIEGEDSWGDRQSSNSFAVEIVDDGSIPVVNAPSIPVLRVGTEMSPVVPTVQYGKTGDVYSLNRPLPSGLSFDEATGVISGTPSNGVHGIHRDYAITVSDVNGRGTTSTLFDLRIRHQDTPVFAAQNHEIRANIAFETDPISITAPEALIGEYSFQAVSGGSGLDIDPVTGVISGSLSTGRQARLRVHDEIGQVGEDVYVTLTTVSLSISLGEESLPEGASVEYLPVARGAVGPDTSYELSSQYAYPAGLSIDPETGEITGTMPFGTYFLKARVTDNGQAAETGWTKWRGTSDDPLNLDFPPLTEQEQGELVESEIIRVTGLPGSAALNVTGTAAEYRICYDAGCTHVKADWRSSGTWVDNAEFIQLRAYVPLGSEEIRTATPTVTGHGSGTWTVASKKLDNIPSASNRLPVAVTPSGIDYRSLYDGNTTSNVTSIGGSRGHSSIVYDFGEPVLIDGYTIIKDGTSSNWSYLEMEVGNEWQAIHSVSGNRTVTFDSPVTAQRVRVRGNSSGYSLTEFRIGSGGPHRNPVLNDPEIIAVLDAGEQSIQLDVDAPGDSYADPNPVSFSYTGSLPVGGDLSPQGLLTLPSAPSTGPGGWEFKVTATDSLGFETEKQFFVFSEGANAAEVFPSASSHPASIYDLYDGAVSPYVSLGRNAKLVLEFEDFVTFDTIAIRQDDNEGLAIEVEIAGQWFQIASGNWTNSSINLGGSYTAKRVRVGPRGTNVSTRAYVGEFRIGGGPFHTVPSIGSEGELANLGSTAQTLQLTAETSPYTDGSASFSIVAGIPPDGLVLHPSGLMDLPERASPGAWQFLVRATDNLGSYGEKQMMVFSEGAPASETLPVSASNASVDTLNDGLTSVYHRLSRNQFIVLEFADFVTFDTIYYRLDSSTGMTLQVEVGDEWIEVRRGSGSAYTHNFPVPYTAKRMRLGPTGTTTSTRADVTEFRIGR